MRKLLSTILILLVLAGCHIQPQTPPPAAATATATMPATDVIASATATPTPTVEPVPSITATQSETDHTTVYIIDVSIDYAQHSANIIETIETKNPTAGELPAIPLVIPPNQTRGAFSLEKISLPASASIEANSWLEHTVWLNFDPPLQPGETISLEIVYSLILPYQSLPLGYTQRQMIFADWYPFIPPLQDDNGWLTDPPYSIGEYLSYDLADFYITLSMLPYNEPLIVAASAPESIIGDAHIFTVQQARNFSFSISPHYQVLQKQTGGIEARVYAFPEHSLAAARAVDLLLDAFQFFNQQLAQHPRGFISMVEAEIDDGLETDGLFYLSERYFNRWDGSPYNYFELLTVHETAHQWFYGMVGSNQAQSPWLDEAFATYSEYLFYESRYPASTSWWWDYRVNGFSPKGWVNTNIYNFTDSRLYINAVYLRGAMFLHALRQEVGDATFFLFLKTYMHDNQGKIATVDDFLKSWADVGYADLSRLLAIYFKP